MKPPWQVSWPFTMSSRTVMGHGFAGATFTSAMPMPARPCRPAHRFGAAVGDLLRCQCRHFLFTRRCSWGALFHEGGDAFAVVLAAAEFGHEVAFDVDLRIERVRCRRPHGLLMRA